MTKSVSFKRPIGLVVAELGVPMRLGKTFFSHMISQGQKGLSILLVDTVCVENELECQMRK
jgi:hypothetical protein